MDALKILSKYHDEWLNIVRLFGDSEFAQDIVQDVYLKVHSNYRERIIQNGEPNRALMWVLLRNTAFRANKTEPNDLSLELFYSLPAEQFELGKHESIDLIYDKVEAEIKTWEWYDQMLFDLYKRTGKSIRDLSKETKISTKSIFQTLKHCKERLKENVGEDYEDYKNTDYELILNKWQEERNKQKDLETLLNKY